MFNQRRKSCLQTKQRIGGGVMKDNKLLEAVKEASISVACLLDDNFESTKELDKDLEHIQDQITIIENYFEEVSGDNT